MSFVRNVDVHKLADYALVLEPHVVSRYPWSPMAIGTNLAESTFSALRDPQIVLGKHHDGHVEGIAMGRSNHP